MYEGPMRGPILFILSFQSQLNLCRKLASLDKSNTLQTCIGKHSNETRTAEVCAQSSSGKCGFRPSASSFSAMLTFSNFRFLPSKIFAKASLSSLLLVLPAHKQHKSTVMHKLAQRQGHTISPIVIFRHRLTLFLRGRIIRGISLLIHPDRLN